MATARRRLILPAGVSTDPPGLGRPRPVRSIFDARPHRNHGIPGIANDCSTREWDNRLIATAVNLGCPRMIAEQARTYPPARLALLQLWCTVQDAAQGDKTARAALDRCRTAFANSTAGRPGEILSASEQPADPSELQTLMGLG